MKLQWYPGHMTKAKRAMQDDIKMVDLVIELLDARIPFSSRNPEIDKLAAGKFRLVLLNKADLAADGVTARWITYFQEKGIKAVSLDSRSRSKLNQIQSLIPEICREKLERDRKKGILNRPIRAMVAGIPNVGKSTFINSLAGKNAAKTGNKPGVTKGNQWIRLNKNVELLDTPGILWPKFDDETVGTHLAFIGSINDEIIDLNELAYEFIGLMGKRYGDILKSRYDIELNDDANQMIEQIAFKRMCLKKGGEADIDRASRLIIEDFRSAKFGKISIEVPEDVR